MGHAESVCERKTTRREARELQNGHRCQYLGMCTRQGTSTQVGCLCRTSVSAPETGDMGQQREASGSCFQTLIIFRVDYRVKSIGCVR